MCLEYLQLFEKATGYAPYPYQTKLATTSDLPSLLSIPTGLGKTAAVVLAWVWRRRFASAETRQATPRRLVYCLPMRVLVEQTEQNVRRWLGNLGLAQEVAVYRLMGGEEDEDWDLYPERDAILVGTQDMLLSRALNRGYAASRARWPMQFGLLHQDCLWVFDEVQLMGAGLATTAQLEAFRSALGRGNGLPCRSLWMSATFNPQWLATIDYDVKRLGDPLELSPQDRQQPALQSRYTADKPLKKAQAAMGDFHKLADEILAHHQAKSLTLIVVNTVARAVKLFDSLAAALTKPKKKKAAAPSSQDVPEIVLIHSRFRPGDRKAAVQAALSPAGAGGTIVVSTQVIEAGADLSAVTLFTELAPWPAMVQRFGRCNRDGSSNAQASVYWIDLPQKQGKKLAPPYELSELEACRQVLAKLSDVGIGQLPQVPLTFRASHVIRKRDMLDLFDTTPDLAGNDIDIDRFVRDVQESDVRVFWREWDGRAAPPPAELPAPHADELCPVLASDFRSFAKESAKGAVWRWDFREGVWQKAAPETIAPGQVLLLHAQVGGYRPDRGWDPHSRDHVDPVPIPGATAQPPEATDHDPCSEAGRWQTIAEHTEELVEEVEALISALQLSGDAAAALRNAARWHDRGKAHPVFQEALPDGAPHAGGFWAKACHSGWKRYSRPRFRHELASALAALDPRNRLIPDPSRDLVAYLVAAHHGKVRLSIRSLPDERPAPHGKRFARGIWDNDSLPETDLGGHVRAPQVTLSLEPMELGLACEPPFAGLPSWTERMLRLRDGLGPFWLAYLEAILRAADMRVSRQATQASPCSSSDMDAVSAQ